MRNPILPGFHPDPSICRVGDDYYLAVSSFEYFPGVPIFHSRDLAHWRPIGHALTRKSQLDLDAAWESGGIYAPTLRYETGRFYLTTTNVSLKGRSGNFIVHTSDPAGEWSEPIWVAQGGIDPSLFFDGPGRAFYTSSDRGGGRIRIVQSVIDPLTGQFLEEPRDIWDGTGGHGPEGPHLYQIEGRYYLMIAEGGTEYGHMVTVARSDSPWGPWESCPHNPILSHRSSGEPIQAVGHADLVQAGNGSWWMVCLGIRPQGYHAFHCLGRETFLAPVAWDADGWPVVGDRGQVKMAFDSDQLPPGHPWPRPEVRDDFGSKTFRFEWNFLRNPVADRFSLVDRPGWLRLRGGREGIDSMQWPTWIGRRQTDLDCAASTCIEFEEPAEGHEAGLAVFQNYRHHYSVAIGRWAGKRAVRCRRKIGSLERVTAEREIGPGPQRLRIVASNLEYRLEWAGPEGSFETLDRGEARYLSTEVGGRFTGVYFALFAAGEGAMADFDWFDYETEIPFSP